jgi:hypothetical protein
VADVNRHYPATDIGEECEDNYCPPYSTVALKAIEKFVEEGEK